MQFIKNLGPLLLFVAIVSYFFGGPYLISIEEDPQTEYEFLKESLINEQELEYNWLRKELNANTWSDKEIREIARCTFDENNWFLDWQKDKFQSIVPEFKSQHELNKYLDSLVIRKVYNEDSLASVTSKHTGRCMSRIKDI
jgi:hypothetical protein